MKWFLSLEKCCVNLRNVVLTLKAARLSSEDRRLMSKCAIHVPCLCILEWCVIPITCIIACMWFRTVSLPPVTEGNVSDFSTLVARKVDKTLTSCITRAHVCAYKWNDGATWSCRDVDFDLWDAALLSEFLRTLYLSFFEIAHQIDYWAWCRTPWQTVTDWCDCSAAWMESPSEESCWYTPVADAWRFIFLNWFLWLKHTQTHTRW